MHGADLILTLAGGLTAALIFGYLTQRLGLSPIDPVILDSVRYYDSTGKEIREYLEKPAELPPLATVEFVIQRADVRGGPGANFLVHWKGQPDADEPLIEAIMLGQSGSAGISFTSVGGGVKTESAMSK